MQQRSEEILWLRLGDMSEYEAFGDDLYAVADALLCSGVEDITRRQGGIEASGKEYCQFLGHNYISLFWGDTDAQIIRELNNKELDEVQLIIGRRLNMAKG